MSNKTKNKTNFETVYTGDSDPDFCDCELSIPLHQIIPNLPSPCRPKSYFQLPLHPGVGQVAHALERM